MNETSIEHESRNTMTHYSSPSNHPSITYLTKPSINLTQAQKRIEDHERRYKTREVWLNSVVEEQASKRINCNPTCKCGVRLQLKTSARLRLSQPVNPHTRVSLSLYEC